MILRFQPRLLRGSASQATRLLACLIIGVVAPLQATAIEIDFTRYLTQTVQNSGESVVHRDSFFAVSGTARLIVTSSDPEFRAAIQLNGTQVSGLNGTEGTVLLEIPVTLVADNAIVVNVQGEAGTTVSVRVKQRADIQLHVNSRVHFNTNVSDFVAAREFYGMLGFQTLTGFPDKIGRASCRERVYPCV